VLFLDELPEFERRCLESLRQVMEERRVAVARASGSVVFPAAFQLVAAANPCPCGWYRSGARDCRCDEAAVARYDARLSGPLLDRIDLHVRVTPVPFRALDGPPEGETSASVRARIETGRALQARRLGTAGATNADIPVDALDALVRATPGARAILGRTAERLALSARAVHRALRVARTVADLAGDEKVGPEAMAEALGFRHEEPGPGLAETADA
jgi:magnesium chelatase family protein